MTAELAMEMQGMGGMGGIMGMGILFMLVQLLVVIVLVLLIVYLFKAIRNMTTGDMLSQCLDGDRSATRSRGHACLFRRTVPNTHTSCS